MASTTSGTTEFILEVDDLIETAQENVGGDYTSAGEQEKARRHLNLILIELQNKNVPLHKIDTTSIALIDGTQEYTLSTSISDVLEATLKTTSSGNETALDRYSLIAWHELPTKSTESRPTLYALERKADTNTLKIWPIPDTTNKWTLEILAVKRIEDITAAYQRVDLPYRYYPLLVAWLSYKLSLTRQGVDENTKNRLKMDLAEIMMDTFEEDRERVDFVITPGGITGR